jgi:basic membrane protein A
MRKMPNRLRPFIVLLVAITTLAAAACSRDDGDAADGDTISVFGAYATQIEEPWDGVIHEALLAEEEAGNITYGFTDDIGE